MSAVLGTPQTATMPGPHLKLRSTWSLKLLSGESGDITDILGTGTQVALHAINQHAGVIDAYSHLAPVINTDAYMVWLRNLVAMKGTKLITRRINGDLLNSEHELFWTYSAMAIANATGLNSLETASDKACYPLRGTLICVVNDGKWFPKVNEALAITHNNELSADHEDIILIFGGIAQPHNVPGLELAEYDPEAPFVQGLRPTCVGNVRCHSVFETNFKSGQESLLAASNPERWTSLSQPQVQYPSTSYQIEIMDENKLESSSPERRKIRKPLLLLSQSRGVQTDPWPIVGP
ncbi:hypothetical protein IW262DRAFT_1299666 [Armillaria fumosa]|nr:hypothetical protein IW262DRAFT_1299666 [Armillaria fumosa]